jgi:phytoene desaturase
VSKKVVIIGAGIGGLATANLLQKAGYHVSVYEKNGQLGGRAGQLKRDGFTFDTGPSWYLMPEVFSAHFRHFNTDVNKVLDIKRLDPAYKAFFENRAPITIKGNLEKDTQQFEEIEAGAGERLRAYVEQGDIIYQMSMRHFLYSNFTSLKDFLNKEVLMSSGKMLRLLTTSIHSRVQTFVTAKPLQQILEYPMVFLGTSPFKAPALYSLMSALDFKEGVFYPTKGMYSIIELMVSIGAKHGVTHHTGAQISSIVHDGGRATGVMIDGKFVSADIVISNADMHHTETRLLDEPARSYPDTFWKKKESGISALLLYIGVKGSLPQLEHHNILFTDSWKENFTDIYDAKNIPTSASIYVSRTTATDPRTAPVGHENIFVLVPLPTGIDVTPTIKKELTDRFIDQLATTLATPDFKERIVTIESFGPNDFKDKFYAWEGTALGMSHLLGQSAMWRIPNTSKKLKNLYYVGASTVPGIGLPMCLISAELVYKRVMGIKRGGPISTIKGDA